MAKDNYSIPPWMAGRFNENGHIAILYNNLSGNAYFFDEDSADVIGELLTFHRGELLDIELIAKKTNTDESSILEFFDELVQNNLLSNGVINYSDISNLRTHSYSERVSALSDSSETNIPSYFDTVENDYREIITEQGIPMSATFELTYNCNENCIHCYNQGAARGNGDKPDRNTDELNLDDYKRLIDDLYELGVVKLTLTGGDPFVKNEFWAILEYACHKKFAIDVYTNGLALYHKQEVERLLSFYPRSIGLSIYSAIPEIHDSITRINGSYNKTIAVAEEISKAGVALYLKCPVMTLNAQSYYTVAEMALKLNAIPQFDVNITAGNDGDTSAPNHLRLDAKAMNLVLRDPIQPLYVGMDAPNKGRKRLDPTSPICGAGTDLVNITPFGEVYPCNAFPLSCGNVKADSFNNIWYNSESLKSVRKVVYQDTDQCGKNSRCHYCNRCIGQSYIETQNLYKNSSDNCFIANIRKDIAEDENYMNGDEKILFREELEKLTLDQKTDFSKEYIKHGVEFTWMLNF